MTRQLALRTLLVAAAFAAATAIAWWALPVAAAVFGAITSRDRASAIVAGIAAIVAWGGLLLWNAWVGPLGRVAATVGAVLQVKPVAVYVLALAFAGLVAVCAALVARAVARGVLGAAGPKGADTARP